jgi:hypothetical protein
VRHLRVVSRQRQRSVTGARYRTRRRSNWLLSVKPDGFGVGREGRPCDREACRVISFHPMVMLR